MKRGNLFAAVGVVGNVGIGEDCTPHHELPDGRSGAEHQKSGQKNTVAFYNTIRFD